VIPTLLNRAPGFGPGGPWHEPGMAFARAVQGAMNRCRRLPRLVRWLLALLLSAAVSGVRLLADGWLPEGYPFLVSFFGVVLSAALFAGGAGAVSTAFAACFAAYYYLPPIGSLRVSDPTHVVALAVFILCGSFTSSVIEALHDSLDRLRAAERGRALLLREFRHRTRNDLASLSAVLLLRARQAPEPAREALREASAHAMALSRVHTRLAAAEPGAGEVAFVETRSFITGLVADIERATNHDGLRPVALEVEAEPWPLETERAVQLGLVLNETVTNALKYAFPGDRSGTVSVRFRRTNGTFRLEVADDGVGLPLGDEMTARGPVGPGLGTRLLRALAAQLRGTFTRAPGDPGTRCELCFPVAAPTAAPPSQP